MTYLRPAKLNENQICQNVNKEILIYTDLFDYVIQFYLRLPTERQIYHARETSLSETSVYDITGNRFVYGENYQGLFETEHHRETDLGEHDLYKIGKVLFLSQ